MQKRIVSSQEEGRSLGRYLEKQLPRAPKSLLYKLLRTKAVKVNGKRVQDPKYSLSSGDQVEIYLADARIAELQASDRTLYNSEQILKGMSKVQVLYDDENLTIFNKPAGMLSQKDRADAISLTEIGAAIIRQNQEDLGGFCPGVCNRLDRNTSGAVIMAKTVRAAQAVNEMIQEGKIHKFYLAIVVGECGWKDSKLLTHYWRKDSKRNTVTVSDLPTGLPDRGGGTMPMPCGAVHGRPYPITFAYRADHRKRSSDSGAIGAHGISDSWRSQIWGFHWGFLHIGQIPFRFLAVSPDASRASATLYGVSTTVIRHGGCRGDGATATGHGYSASRISLIQKRGGENV